MEMDDVLCFCFHVRKRKVVNFIRIEKPSHVAQLSECFGAGTGCGWCRPMLKQLFDHRTQQASDLNLPDSSECASRRANYIRDGGGTPPPGAIPIDQPEPE